MKSALTCLTFPISFRYRDCNFKFFVRPTELCENPEMIYAISSFSIKQVNYYEYWEKKNAVKSSETQILILDFKRSYIPNNLTPNYVKQQFKLEYFQSRHLTT